MIVYDSTYKRTYLKVDALQTIKIESDYLMFNAIVRIDGNNFSRFKY